MQKHGEIASEKNLTILMYRIRQMLIVVGPKINLKGTNVLGLKRCVSFVPKPAVLIKFYEIQCSM